MTISLRFVIPGILRDGERREHRLIAHFKLLKDMMKMNLNLYRR